MVSTDVGIWIGAILTLCCYSYYISNKQNAAFRFAQSTLVGASLGMSIVLIIAKNVDQLALLKIRQGDWTYAIPVVLGLLIYFRFVPRREYLARIPVAIIVSAALGLAARATMDSEVFRMISGTANLLIRGVSPFDAFSNTVVIFGVLVTISYFFFTLNPKVAGKLGPVNTLGRYFLMIYFGSKYGSTLLSRMTFLLGRLQFLVFDWLGIPH